MGGGGTGAGAGAGACGAEGAVSPVPAIPFPSLPPTSRPATNRPRNPASASGAARSHVEGARARWRWCVGGTGLREGLAGGAR